MAPSNFWAEWSRSADIYKQYSWNSFSSFLLQPQTRHLNFLALISACLGKIKSDNFSFKLVEEKRQTPTQHWQKNEDQAHVD